MKKKQLTDLEFVKNFSASFSGDWRINLIEEFETRTQETLEFRLACRKKVFLEKLALKAEATWMLELTGLLVHYSVFASFGSTNDFQFFTWLIKRPCNLKKRQKPWYCSWSLVVRYHTQLTLRTEGKEPLINEVVCFSLHEKIEQSR